MAELLLNRFMTQGTLADPKGVPDPNYSLPGTLNWMRALAILVKDEDINAASMKNHCAVVTKGTLSDQAINTVFEQLLMSLHHLASLKAMGTLAQRTDTARSAIVTWYYGIYHAASAMIAAQDGAYQENHGETANTWDRQFSGRPYVPRPFNYRVTTLVGKDVDAEIAAYRGNNTFKLDHTAVNPQQAFGACMSYLKGSADWRTGYFEEDLKRRELKKLGLENFRTKNAREIRDERLKGKALGFVHQAFRYRGKANYREALFISYGQHVEPMLEDFYVDMFSVLQAFLCMAGAFCAQRVGKDLWNAYLDDLSANVMLLVKPSELWVAM